MGICSSAISDAVDAANGANCNFYADHPEQRSNKQQFDRLLLSEYDINRLYKQFVKIDQDLSGEIATWELLEYLKLERTKFTKRIFRIFDEDGSGQIDFREFVIALWNYCTLGKPALIMFAFDLYDQDGSGLIDYKEVELMLKEVYGRSFEKNTHAQIIRKKIGAATSGDKGDAITVDYFAEFVRKHPALLFPAFELQTNIQRHIVGSEFWEDASEQRLKLSNGQYVTINQILKAHISNDAFNSLVNSNAVVDARSSKENASQKEKMKGALQMTGLHGERRFKGSFGKQQGGAYVPALNDLDTNTAGDDDDTFTDFNKWKAFKDEDRKGGVAAFDDDDGPETPEHSDAKKRWKKAGTAVKATNKFKSPPRKDRGERSSREAPGGSGGRSGSVRKERRSSEKKNGLTKPTTKSSSSRKTIRNAN